MNSLRRGLWGASLAIVMSLPARATLVLNTDVTSSFVPATTTTNTFGNDLPAPRPSTLYFGQLQASSAGYVDFFYVGNEAGYTNSLLLDGATVHSTYGLPDNFNAPYPLLGSVYVGAGSFVDFGFCTSGGVSIGAYGRCAHNDDAASLIAQFNYGTVGGYRSIGFHSLDAFNPQSRPWDLADVGSAARNLWMILWDDSGAKNDDNHDDYVAVARFRPVSVPEPGTLMLLVVALIPLVLIRRRGLART